MDKLTYGQRVRALADLIRNTPPETEEEIDEYLRENGYDPEQLVMDMRARIEPLLKAAQGRLDKDGHL